MKVLQRFSRTRRAKRVRSKISGSSLRPRLSVFRSGRGISIQVIDDTKGNTLVWASWRDMKKPFHKNTADQAKEIGKLVAKRCLEKNIHQVVFDRSRYSYHGKVKAVSEGAREAGLRI